MPKHPLNRRSPYRTLLECRELGWRRRPSGLDDRIAKSTYRNLTLHGSQLHSYEQIRQEGKVTAGLTGGIFNLEFNAEGTILVAACEKKNILMFDPITRKLVHSIEKAHDDCVNCIRFLDSRSFATCSDDTTVALWDARFLKRRVRTLRGHSNWVKNIEYSFKENLLVTSGFDGAIFTWDINRYSDAEEADFTRCFYTNGLMRMRLTPGGDKMVVSTMNGFLMIIHDLSLSDLKEDLQGFKPNLYRLMQLSGRPLPIAAGFTRLFHVPRNRVEILADFAPDNDAEIISSLQLHPQGWVAVSRNTSSDDRTEFCCVHDIQSSPPKDTAAADEGETAADEIDGDDVIRAGDEARRQARAGGGSGSGLARLSEFLSAENVGSTPAALAESAAVAASAAPRAARAVTGALRATAEAVAGPSGALSSAGRAPAAPPVVSLSVRHRHRSGAAAAAAARGRGGRRRIRLDDDGHVVLDAADSDDADGSGGDDGNADPVELQSVNFLNPESISLLEMLGELRQRARNLEATRDRLQAALERRQRGEAVPAAAAAAVQDMASTADAATASPSAAAAPENAAASPPPPPASDDSAGGILLIAPGVGSTGQSRLLYFGSAGGVERAQRRDQKVAEGTKIQRNTNRLTHYIEESNTGRGFIKELCFSPDGRVFCSPFGFGIRLLAFDASCAELSHCLPQPQQMPVKLYEVGTRFDCHSETVLASAFAPHGYTLVTGCLAGKLVWHQPVL